MYSNRHLLKPTSICLSGHPYSWKSPSEAVELCFGFHTFTINFIFMLLSTTKFKKSITVLKLENN